MRMSASIEPLRACFEVRWMIVFDIAVSDPIDMPGAMVDGVYIPLSCYGYGQRNHAIDRITDGWLYFLDDDNLIHPALADLGQLIRENPNKRAFAFDQEHIDGWIRTVSPETMKVNHVDMAQVAIRRDLIGDDRFPLQFYNGDGMFIQNAYEKAPDDWLFEHRVMSYYNALR